MSYRELYISGYPTTWDSLNVRDFLLKYGSVLRVRSIQKGFSFVTFDTQHSYPNLSQLIRSGNSKITVKPPEKTEDYKFDTIPPHAITRNQQVGFIRWQEDAPFFVEMEKFYPHSLCIIKGQILEFHFWMNNTKYKIYTKLKHIASISCTETAKDFNVFLQFNQPPELYRNDPNRKFFQIWTIGINEPGWKRVTSIFESMTEFLSFEIKKLSVTMVIDKEHNSGLVESLRNIQVFTEYPLSLTLPEPLKFKDIDESSLSFQVKFMLYSLVSLTIISVYDLSKELLDEIGGLDSARVVSSIQSIISSHKSLALRTLPDFRSLFFSYFNDDPPVLSELSSEYECINRVIVTPTTSYFRIGEPELSNRVTRNFEYCKEDFLRVTFTDENLNKILPYPDELLQRVEDLLKKFPIAGKNFSVLAFSASQLKQHSVWMLAECAPVTQKEIVDWLGDFSAIRVPGKYVARIGLSFSASKKILELAESEIKYIDDVFYNGFNFSDGAGTISLELASEINGIAGTNSCAFQFRMGGAKGVVCVDDRLHGRVICLRNSLVKYHSQLRVFELLNPSEFRYGFLNRQLIMLLNTLGTPEEVFMTLHKEMLQNLENDCKSFFCCMRSMNGTNLAMQCLEKVMSRKAEPLAVEIKSLLIKRALSQLRKKQKIFLKNSGCIIGVIDEKSCLDYGQVFLQVLGRVIEGKVIVAKNPCLHPGDIRVLTAVSRPELLYLRDVLVFPCKGDRPHTNECSGSDLDGDLYFVTWEQRLIPPKVHSPMIYDSTPPMEEPGPYGVNTLISFFRKFVTNDRLGQIDNSHMAIADSSNEYANDERCKHLSELHAIAVDFAKTGNIVIVPKEYTNIPFPDFMEFTSQSMYESTKILGKLYREVKEIPEIEIPDIDSNNLVDGYQKEMGKARELVGNYKKDVEMLMNRFGVACEIEMIIAQPLEISNYFQKKKREDEMRELLNYVSNKVVEKHRKIFSESSSCELASACYFVSHKEIMARAYPWVIAYEYLE